MEDAYGRTTMEIALFAKDREDLDRELGVEIGGRLISEDNVRGLKQHPGYCGPLLLAARYFPDRFIRKLPNA